MAALFLSCGLPVRAWGVGADGLQRSLVPRSRFQQQLRPSVWPLTKRKSCSNVLQWPGGGYDYDKDSHSAYTR